MKDTVETRQLDGVPIEWTRYWFECEQLPPDWESFHTMTLLQTISTINWLRSAMSGMRKEAKAEGQATKGEAAAETAVKVQSAGVAQVEDKRDNNMQAPTEKELSTDDENIEGLQTLTVPPLVHSKTASSVTSDTFIESLFCSPLLPFL
ncbi:uncharacterized protein PHACADRAFT_157116 [Phanerochaete carnosa HHB-10118-sp]|uniref:Uncharacterized protein n=1 Tax=Phanerochaete carnosa (strain HHB-10118-sp) TaxID=650164 RepID=K5V7K2_PHACS|nr:uncharacterized protein PHACADRAFT_157116 [Phanerochaete carnosa HHB-10118-sp]EKM58751.1 hypothetical protein PHACADRAFT_157116 [Phanerochaete carnosa HHB-10118-sp]